MMMMINTPPTPTSSSSSSIAAAGNNKAMVQQRHQDPLKCPRCDSANTKFCYYNNYSLSQPRHFCKACKRYWTRGGTLRNVPVGGGCRKNTKRHSKNKRLQLTSKSAAPKVDHPPQISLPAATCSDLSSFFYRSAAATNSDVNTSVGSFAGLLRPVFCDIQPQLGAFGHGGLISSTGGFNNVSISDHMIHPSAMTLLSDHYLPSFTSQAASLLVSSLKQPKMSDEYHQFMLPYDENLDQGNNNVNLGLTKEDQVKVEGNNDNNTESEWPVIPPFESAFSVNSSSVDVAAATDSSYLYWNSSALLGSGSGWTDAMNSSLAPLI